MKMRIAPGSAAPSLVKMRMRLTYYAVFPLVAVAILSMVQAVHIAGGFRGRRDRR